MICFPLNIFLDIVMMRNFLQFSRKPKSSHDGTCSPHCNPQQIDRTWVICTIQRRTFVSFFSICLYGLSINFDNLFFIKFHISWIACTAIFKSTETGRSSTFPFLWLTYTNENFNNHPPSSPTNFC